MNLDVSQGSLADLGDDGVMVSKEIATAQGWKLGDVIPAEFAVSGKHRLHVVAIYDGKGWISDNFVISLDAQTAFAGPQLVASGLVTLAAGADKADVQKAISAALADHPDAKVLDQKGFEKEASGFIGKLLTFVTVMLLLAVLIALLGIVNTLALSVFERTRELGLLRAVGMTRAQVRAMVRWESVVISLIGAVSGAGLGIGIGLALSQALKDEGIKAISIPGPPDRPVRRAGRGGRRAGRRRSGPLGRQGRRPESGGQRLTHPDLWPGSVMLPGHRCVWRSCDAHGSGMARLARRALHDDARRVARRARGFHVGPGAGVLLGDGPLHGQLGVRRQLVDPSAQLEVERRPGRIDDRDRDPWIPPQVAQLLAAFDEAEPHPLTVPEEPDGGHLGLTVLADGRDERDSPGRQQVMELCRDLHSEPPCRRIRPLSQELGTPGRQRWCPSLAPWDRISSSRGFGPSDRPVCGLRRPGSHGVGHRTPGPS